MSISFGPKLGLIIDGLQGDGHYAAILALFRALDQLPFLSVINRTTTAPPGSPANGAAYIVATGGTGAWSGHDKSVAVWTTDNPAAPSGEWEFYAPQQGWLAWSVADAAFYSYSGTAWVVLAGGGGGGGSTTGSTQTASYIATLGDANNLIVMNVAAANNFTVPPNSSVAFPLWTTLTIIQLGAGQTTLVSGAGVTFLTPSSLTVRAQNGTVSLTQIATDTWIAAGDLT